MPKTTGFEDLSQEMVDYKWMSRALDLARKAAQLGEVPVGAIILDPQGEPLAETFNLRESLNSPIAHAEILAIEKASQVLGSWRLNHCTLYVTLEPCPMCAGALVNARLGRLVYGASDPKAGAAGSIYNIASDPRLNHRAKVTSGVLEDSCALILKQFFQGRRESARKREETGRTPENISI